MNVTGKGWCMMKKNKVKVFNLFDLQKPEETPHTEVSKPKSHKSYAVDSDSYTVRKYVGRTTCGFIHNHKYLVKLTKNSDVGFTVSAIEDITNDDEVNIGLRLSSENSWNYFFKVV